MPVDGRGHVTDLPGQLVALVARGLSLRIHTGDALVQGGLVSIHPLRDFARIGLDLLRLRIHVGDAGFESSRLRLQVGLRLIRLLVHVSDRIVGGLLVRIHLRLQVGARLVGFGCGILRLFARIIDARLGVLTDLFALLDRLIRLRGGVIGGLPCVLRRLVDSARVHQRQLVAVPVDAVHAVLRAIADDDVRVTACRDAHGAHLVGLLGQGEAHGLHAQAQAERRIVWI